MCAEMRVVIFFSFFWAKFRELAGDIPAENRKRVYIHILMWDYQVRMYTCSIIMVVNFLEGKIVSVDEFIMLVCVHE